MLVMVTSSCLQGQRIVTHKTRVLMEQVTINFNDLKANDPVAVVSIHFNKDKDCFVDNISLSQKSIDELKQAMVIINDWDGLDIDEVVVNTTEEMDKVVPPLPVKQIKAWATRRKLYGPSGRKPF